MRFVSVAGNHSRITPNKKDALKDERLDDLIEWYLEARLMNNDRVTVGLDGIGEKIDSSMYVMEIRGKTYCGVHGDYDPTARNIQTLQTMVGHPLHAVLSGHLDHNSVGIVQGIRTVMAGSFVGMDDYCIEKRIFGHPEQMICVCDNKGISCYYNVELK